MTWMGKEQRSCFTNLSFLFTFHVACDQYYTWEGRFSTMFLCQRIPKFIQGKCDFAWRSRSKKLGVQNTPSMDLTLGLQVWIPTWSLGSQTSRIVFLSGDCRGLTGKWCHTSVNYNYDITWTMTPCNSLRPNFHSQQVGSFHFGVLWSWTLVCTCSKYLRPSTTSPKGAPSFTSLMHYFDFHMKFEWVSSNVKLPCCKNLRRIILNIEQ